MQNSSLRGILGLGCSNRYNLKQKHLKLIVARIVQLVSQEPLGSSDAGPKFCPLPMKTEKVQHNPTYTNRWPSVSYMTTHMFSTTESRTWRYQTLKHLSYLEARISNRFLSVHCLDLLGSQSQLLLCKV